MTSNMKRYALLLPSIKVCKLTIGYCQRIVVNGARPVRSVQVTARFNYICVFPLFSITATFWKHDSGLGSLLGFDSPV